MKLTNEERETIITWDETSGPADIFTYNKAYQRHLEKNLHIKPKSSNGYGGREYEIDKKRIPMPRAPRKISPENRARMVANLAQLRAKKLSATKKLEGVKQKGIVPRGRILRQKNHT